MPTTIEEFREHLAQYDDPQSLDAIALGAVFTGWVAGDEFDGSNKGPTVGTIVQVVQQLGMGLFGPTVYTSVKLCPACVHKPSDGCPPVDSLELLQVIALDHVRRNGDTCTCESGEYCDLDSSPLAVQVDGSAQ